MHAIVLHERNMINNENVINTRISKELILKRCSKWDKRKYLLRAVVLNDLQKTISFYNDATSSFVF